jgi:NodT family efflux transporter outer membrane factor (OMF) lipoprotein
VLSLRDRLAIARANLENAERVLAIVQSRVRNGAASPLDLAQQEGVVAGQRAAIPGLVQDERFARASLAVLLGRPPEGFDVAGTALSPVRSPHVTPGLPSALLLRRPDLQSAEWALRGAEADVDAARAAFFPQIDLTGSGGLQSTALATLFSGAGGFYTIAASLTQPIFQGGALAGALKQAQGRRAEAIATYRGAVFQAFADVEIALGDIGNQSDQLRYRADQAGAAQRAFRISESQYREGATDFLTVLDAQRTLYAVQDSLAQAKLAALQADVTLFRVLGGGWPAQ